MDPVTAVALAGNLLQFTQFVVGLFNDARKLHASATGTSSNNNHIQDVCGMLIDFDGHFRQPQSASSTNTSNATSRHGKQLAEFATKCKQDCDVLLEKMNKLKVVGAKGPRHWRSFRAALSEVWQSGEIEEYRTRIADRQRAMTLLLCAASNESILALQHHIQDLGKGIWTLHNDSRLDSMIEELRKLGKYIRHQDQKTTTSEDVDRICSEVSKMSLETRAFEREAQVLAKLNYMDRTNRYERIPRAHFTTFKWSLKNIEQAEAKYAKLQQWLRGDDTLFWVSGKPGSGKSTFMKYIADSEETKECLEAWAKTRELLVVSHYFTICGTPIQRSLEGLLRSLLFGVLLQKPELIPKLIPDDWEMSSVAPQQSDLQALLRLLGVQMDELFCKAIFFIDGLDEFEGDHIDVCETLKELSRSPFIKVCISSRPWNVFEDALGNKPDSKLYIHELTHGDILDYTMSHLQAHPRWEILLEEFSTVMSMSLIEEVASKSNGVFLWVTLVVRLLREGLTNDDSLSDLQRRLASFPADLKEFFRYIIRSVDPFYHEKMAGTLSLALEAQEPLSIEVFSVHDLEYDNENYAFEDVTDTELMPTDTRALEKVFRSVSRRINGRCKGLLERNGDRMEFLHRTVYDFLHTGEMDNFLGEHTKNRRCASLSLLKAFVAWIKRSTFLSRHLRRHNYPMRAVPVLNARLRQGLRYARVAEMQGESSAALTAALLDHLEPSLLLMVTRGQVRHGGTDLSFVLDLFRRLVLEAGVIGYVRNRLSNHLNYLTSRNASRIESPLHTILNPPYTLGKSDQYWILKKLLESGQNPNHLLDDPRATDNLRSPWEALFHHLDKVDQLSRLSDSRDLPRNTDLLAMAEERIILLMLEYGADTTVTARIRIRNADVSMPIWLMFLLTLCCAHSPKRPAVFEETLSAMLDGFGTLEHTTVVREHKSTSNTANFWDVCESWKEFALPTTAGLCGDEALTRVFVRVLAKIPAEHQSFVKAEAWCRKMLSASAANELESAVTSMRSRNHLRVSKKRGAVEGQENPRNTKRSRKRRR